MFVYSFVTDIYDERNLPYAKKVVGFLYWHPFCKNVYCNVDGRKKVLKKRCTLRHPHVTKKNVYTT